MAHQQACRKLKSVSASPYLLCRTRWGPCPWIFSQLCCAKCSGAHVQRAKHFGTKWSGSAPPTRNCTCIVWMCLQMVAMMMKPTQCSTCCPACLLIDLRHNRVSIASCKRCASTAVLKTVSDLSWLHRFSPLLICASPYLILVLRPWLRASQPCSCMCTPAMPSPILRLWQPANRSGICS